MDHIFTCDVELESAECVEQNWKLFDEALQEYKDDRKYEFDPFGFVQDEAGGL